jgi:hypothetical protein
MRRIPCLWIATGTWKRRMWSWDSRSGVTILITESRVGLGSEARRTGWERRSWERRVVGSALSVDM